MVGGCVQVALGLLTVENQSVVMRWYYTLILHLTEDTTHSTEGYSKNVTLPLPALLRYIEILILRL